MRLVADVGNTETVLGVVGAEATTLEGHWRLSTLAPRTLDEFRHLLRGLLEADGFRPGAVDQVVIASVVPSTTSVLADALGSCLGRCTSSTARPSSPSGWTWRSRVRWARTAS